MAQNFKEDFSFERSFWYQTIEAPDSILTNHPPLSRVTVFCMPLIFT